MLHQSRTHDWFPCPLISTIVRLIQQQSRYQIQTGIPPIHQQSHFLLHLKRLRFKVESITANSLSAGRAKGSCLQIYAPAKPLPQASTFLMAVTRLTCEHAMSLGTAQTAPKCCSKLIQFRHHYKQPRSAHQRKMFGELIHRSTCLYLSRIQTQEIRRFHKWIEPTLWLSPPPKFQQLANSKMAHITSNARRTHVHSISIKRLRTAIGVYGTSLMMKQATFWAQIRSNLIP